MMIKALFKLADIAHASGTLKSLEALCSMMPRDGKPYHCGIFGHNVKEIVTVQRIAEELK